MTPEQKIFIRNNYPSLSLTALSKLLTLDVIDVLRFCHSDDFKLHPLRQKEKLIKAKIRHVPAEQPVKKRIWDRIVYVEKKPVLFQRPKTVYTNSPSPYGIADELYNRKLVKPCRSWQE